MAKLSNFYKAYRMFGLVWKKSWQKRLFYLFLGLFIIGFMGAMFLVSVGLVALPIISLLIYFSNSKEKRVLLWKSLKKHPEIWVLFLIFLQVLIWGLNTSDMDYFLDRLRIKVNFLTLPLAFFIIPKIKKANFHQILTFFSITLLIFDIGILLNYFVHFEEIQIGLSQGQPIPPIKRHIRFSLLNVIALNGLLYLLLQPKAINTNKNQVIWKITFIGLLLFVHFLAVRSGLLALYPTLFIIISLHFFKNKKYINLIGVCAILFLSPIIAIKTIPSLNQKWDYMKWDYQKMQEGDIKNYSDGERFLSQKIGLEIFKENFWLGTGTGNLNLAVHNKYAKRYASLTPKRPHNQFISVASSFGLIGFFIFLFLFYFPLIYKQNYKNNFILGLYIIYSTSFLVENSIENTVGLSMFLCFLLLAINVKPKKIK